MNIEVLTLPMFRVARQASLPFLTVSRKWACTICGASLPNIYRTYTSRNILQLDERGLFADLFPDDSNSLIAELTKKTQTIYSGFDPTADSLHVGNLLVVMALLHCQRAGHQVIALVGGATAQIGDPSGRSTERDEIDLPVVQFNADGIAENLKRIFKNHEDFIWRTDIKSDPLKSVRVVNNVDWYNSKSIIKFLREIGRHFRMGTLLSRSSVQARLSSAQGMSYAEFTYQVLQAYDWLHLHDHYDCLVQIGGNDQIGNIASGQELVSRKRNKQVYGLTVPLITTDSGEKFGKSAGNAIWLDPKKTSPFELYQFFVRLKDSEVQRFLQLFTFYPMKDISKIMEKHWEKPERRHAQKLLAEKVTLLVHGETGVKTAKKATDLLYGSKPEALAEMTAEDLALVFNNASTKSLLLAPGTTVIDLGMKAGCFKYESDAKRIIEAGGFYINQTRVNNPSLVLIPGAHILPNNITLVRVGKKNYHIIKWL
ncbi:tyrosine--tRNA ligase, mitochondrial isoform X2 [Oratosquilla oratoria]|uniref:tyrosine--tRNA ligase, mitochondrial isoform X2 n=1 Tax=Oratosquilla oratoria TaxID=337810 RepID=UPI003F76D4A7